MARTSRRTVALIVDEVTGVSASSEQASITTAKILPGIDHVDGVIKVEDGLVLIHDLETFLSLEEEKKLNIALKSRTVKK
jgi:purine-binding chemotaxis protein CheW